MNVGTISVDIQFNEQSINESIQRLQLRARQLKLDICPEFCKDAFQYKIDDKPLQAFEQSINKLTKHIQAQAIAVRLKINSQQVDRDLLTILGKAENRTVTIRQKVARNERTGYQAQSKEIVLGLQKIEQAVKSQRKNFLSNIITGFGESTGANLNKQIIAGVRDVFGKDAATSVRKFSRSASKFVKGAFVENESFTQATEDAQKILGDRLRKGLYRFGDGIIAVLEDREGDFKSRFNKFSAAISTGVNYQSLGQEINNDLSSAFNKVKAGLVSEQGLRKLTQPLGEWISSYRELTLKERALPLVRERALEILQSNKTKNTANIVNADTKELIIASGGYAGARGLSGARLAKEFNKQNIEGRQALWIKNEDSDLPKEAMSNAQQKLIALLTSISKPNLRGYSKDALEMAAQALAAKERNPQIQIKLLGESGGGFVAEEASKILDLLGVENQFLGVGTPNFIGRLDNKDRKIISPDEILGAETSGVYARLGLANITPSQRILGVKGHPYENYRDANIAELQNFLYGSPGKATPELLTDFKQGIGFFKAQDKSKLDSRQLEQLAGAAYHNLQHIRRYMLVETGNTRKELEKIVAEFEEIFVDLTPENRDMSEARENIKLAEEHLNFLRTKPGIYAGMQAEQTAKDLEQLKNSLADKFAKSVGITQSKYQKLIKDITKTQEKLLDPSLSKRIPPNPKVDAYRQYQKVIGTRQALQPVGEVDFSVLKQQEPPTPKIDIEASLNRAKEITNQFSAAYKEIQNTIKSREVGKAESIAKFTLQNIARAKADIEALRQAADIPKIGTSEAARINQMLGQLGHTEKRIKQNFAKHGLKLPEIESPQNLEQNAILIGENLTGAIAEGMQQALPELKISAKKAVDVAEEAVKSEAEIQSPSRLFMRLGAFMGEGLQKGIDSISINFNKILSFGKLGAAIAIGVNLFQTFGNELIAVGRELEALETKLNFGAGGKIEAAKAMSYIATESNRLGLNLKNLTDSYADFLAATKDTPLKGFAAEQLFKGIQEASSVRQLSQADVEGVNRAIVQILGKGTVQREELVGQLGERLTGSLDLAARARGQTLAEFNRDTQKGRVISEEFLPQFAQALSAEAALSLPNAVNSSQAIINRYENSILSLQATMSKPLVNIANTGLQALTFAIDTLNKGLPVLSSMLGVVLLRALASLAPELKLVTTTLMNLASGLTGGAALGIKSLATGFAKLSLQTAGLLALVEAIQALNKAFSSGSGELTNYSKTISDGLKRFKDIQAEGIGKKVNRFTKANDLNLLIDKQTGEAFLPESAIGQGLLGFLPDRIKADEEGLKRWAFAIRGAIQEVEKIFGDYAKKARNDRASDVEDILSTAKSTANEINGLLNSGIVAEQNSIDKKLRELANQRRAIALTDPDNADAVNTIIKKEQELLKRRADIARPTQVLQAQNASVIETLKKSIEELDRISQIPSQYQNEYRQMAANLRKELENAERSQQNLNRAIKQGLDTFTLFGQRVDRAIDSFNDFKIKSDNFNLLIGSQINQFSLDDISTEQQSTIKQQLEIQVKSAELKQLQQTLAELRALISEQQNVLTPYGININSGSNEIQTLLEQVGEDSAAGNTKLVLEKLLQYKQLEQQLPGLINEVTQSQTELTRNIRDSAKAVNEFYRGLIDNANNLSIETRQISASNRITDAKLKLKSALVGNQETFISSYVDGLINLMESLNRPLENALEAQKQLLAVQQQRIQQLNQVSELSRQSPITVSGNLVGSLNPTTTVSTATNTSTVSMVGKIASPSTSQTLNQVLSGSVSAGQGFFGRRSRGNHAGIDFDTSEGLGGHSMFKAIFPGKVQSITAWGKGYTDRIGGENSNAIRVVTPLSNGMEFLTDYGHYETPSARVRPGQIIDAGFLLGRLAGNDTGSQGGHLDVKIRIPSQLAKNFKTTQPDPRRPGMHFVEVKEFMNWYANTQVGKPIRLQSASASSNNVDIKSNNFNSVGYTTGSTNNKSTPNSVGRTTVNPSSNSVGNNSNSVGYTTGTYGVPSSVSNLRDFVKYFEGFKSNAYWDYGHYSIGYGTPAKSPNEKGITREEGERRLQDRLTQIRQSVIKQLSAAGINNLSNNEIDALTSLAFNTGTINYPKLMAALRKGDKKAAANQFLDINKAGGRVLSGLTRRRQAEAQMFLGQSSGAITSPSISTTSSNTNLNTGSITYSNPNREALLQSSQQISINATQQEANIRNRLLKDNQLAILEAEISRTKLRNQFEEGIKDAEQQANLANRRLEDQRQSIGFDSPQKQRDIQIRDINREYVDSVRDLSDQLNKLQSARRTLDATRKLISSGQFPQLASELPQIENGIKRLDSSINQISEVLNQSDKVRIERIRDIDAKFAIEENKRTRTFEIQQEKIEASRLRSLADSIELEQAGDIGNLGLGDPITLRSQAQRLEIIANLKEQILQLEDMQRNGERGSIKQLEELRAKYEAIATTELDTNNLKLQRDLLDRILKIEDRNIAIQQRSVDFESQKNELLAQRNELITRATGDLTLESPQAIRLKNQIASGDLELKKSILEIKRFAFEQNLSLDQTNKLIAGITELDSLRLDNLRRELKLVNEEQARAIDNANFEFKKRITESNNALLQAQGEFYTTRGLSDRNQQKQIALNQQALSLEEGLRGIDDYARSVNLSAENVNKLKENLLLVNQIKLDNIKAQFDPFQEVAKSAIGGLQSSIEGLLNGTMNFGDAFQNIGQAISNTLARLAAEWLTNELVRGLFGIKSPSLAPVSNNGGLLSGLFGSIGSIFGFAEGGIVGNYNHKALRALPVIGEALNKEGNNAVLIAATPGEQILNVNEAKIYRSMFPKGISGYKSGGTVGNIPTITPNFSKVSNTSTNQVNINIAQQNNNELDVNALRRVILDELNRQSDIRGILYRT